LKMSSEPEGDMEMEYPTPHNADMESDADQSTGTDGEAGRDASATKGMGKVIALDAFRKK